MLQSILELSGHTVTVANNGSQGVELARTIEPQATVCDLGLPGEWNGFDVAEELRRHPDTASMVLVALTGYARSEDKARCEAAGFDAHLSKPVDVTTLCRLLRKLKSTKA